MAEEEASASAGAKIYIGPVTAAADITAYAALSFTEIKGAENIGEFGDESSLVTFLGLSSKRVQKMKGADDAGDIAATFAHLPLDPGQLAVRAAKKTKFSYAIKVVTEDSADANDTDSTFYFHAKIMRAKTAIGGANDVLKFNTSFAITTEIFEDLSEAVA